MYHLGNKIDFTTHLRKSYCHLRGPKPRLNGKDLILLSIDTLRTDQLPFYGAERETAGNPRQKWSLAWIAANGPQNAGMVRRLIAGATVAD